MEYNRKAFKYPEDIHVYHEGRFILISVHAIKRARERDIIFPDQIYNVLRSGKVSYFGKNLIRFTLKTSDGSLICIGEILTSYIIIKTVERGN